VIDPAASPSTSRSKGSRTRNAAAVALAVLALAALGVGAWRGYEWAHADKAVADQRDAALDGARQAAVNLNSIDPGDVEGSVNTMKSSATGDMFDQIDQNKDQLVQLAGQSKARLDAGVLSAALTELNTDENSAKALVVITQTTTNPDQQPTKQRLTWTLDMRCLVGC
jgi:Mce-associated membrane protein